MAGYGDTPRDEGLAATPAEQLRAFTRELGGVSWADLSDPRLIEGERPGVFDHEKRRSRATCAETPAPQLAVLDYERKTLFWTRLAALATLLSLVVSVLSLAISAAALLHRGPGSSMDHAPASRSAPHRASARAHAACATDAVALLASLRDGRPARPTEPEAPLRPRLQPPQGVAARPTLRTPSISRARSSCSTPKWRAGSRTAGAENSVWHDEEASCPHPDRPLLLRKCWGVALATRHVSSPCARPSSLDEG
jgi:hypothetical protein